MTGKIELDKGKSVATVLIDLSETFDTISHDLLVMKLYICLWSTWCGARLVYRYLWGRKQCVVMAPHLPRQKLVLVFHKGQFLSFSIFATDLPEVVRE